MPLPIRKKNRLDGYNYQEYGGYFVTLCSAGRKPIFWADPKQIVAPSHLPRLSIIGTIVREELSHIQECYSGVYVGKSVIMPDHIHLILFLQNENGEMNPSLSRVIQQFKGSITKKVGKPIWQKSFYDRVIRDDTEYQTIWKYLEENPMALYMDPF